MENTNTSTYEQNVLKNQMSAEIILGFTEPYTLADVKAKLQELRDKAALDPNAFSCWDSIVDSPSELFDEIDSFYDAFLGVFPSSYSVTPGVLPKYTPLMKFARLAQNIVVIPAMVTACIILVVLAVVMFISNLAGSDFLANISAVLIYLVPIAMNTLIWAKIIVWFVYGRRGLAL